MAKKAQVMLSAEQSAEIAAMGTFSYSASVRPYTFAEGKTDAIVEKWDVGGKVYRLITSVGKLNGKHPQVREYDGFDEDGDLWAIEHIVRNTQTRHVFALLCGF